MIQKLFVNKNGQIHLSCPKCDKSRHKNVSKYMALSLDQAIQFNYNCPCGNSFSVMVERRRSVRKKVNFKGKLIYNRQEYNVLVFDIVVLDISRFGLKIRLIDKFNIREGQKIDVKFQLDDKTKSNVSKKAVVRNVEPPNIGVEFPSGSHYDKFGAYILFYFNDLKRE